MTYEFSDDIRAFLQEKRYLQNVSPKTIILYEWCFRAFPDLEVAAIKRRVAELREKGLTAVTVNTYLRHIKSYFLWKEQKWELPWLKEEQKVLNTLTAEQVKRIRDGHPVGRNETRARVGALIALDSGLRVQELLNLRRSDVDFDNLLLRVNGKGNKQRLVPMSVELRKLLFRYLSNAKFDHVLVTVRGTQPSQRNLSRDFKRFAKRHGITGVRVSFHTLRHSFAVNYLRAGGNLYYLQRILGHSSITTTEKYLRSLGIADLQKVHDGLSLLHRA